MPVPHGVEGSSLSFEKPVGWYMPNNVELVRLRMLRVRAGVDVPSICGVDACSKEGFSFSVGVGGSEGGGEESSKGRRGLGFSDSVSVSSWWL